jgi:hypothetical protein
LRIPITCPIEIDTKLDHGRRAPPPSSPGVTAAKLSSQEGGDDFFFNKSETQFEILASLHGKQIQATHFWKRGEKVKFSFFHRKLDFQELFPEEKKI